MAIMDLHFSVYCLSMTNWKLQRNPSWLNVAIIDLNWRNRPLQKQAHINMKHGNELSFLCRNRKTLHNFTKPHFQFFPFPLRGMKNPFFLSIIFLQIVLPRWMEKQKPCCQCIIPAHCQTQLGPVCLSGLIRSRLTAEHRRMKLLRWSVW